MIFHGGVEGTGFLWPGVGALPSADKRGPSGPRLSFHDACMLTEDKHGCRVTVMPKEKDPPRRMQRDPAGREYPAVQVRSFWIEEPAHKATAAAAAENRLDSVVDQLRKMMRDLGDNNGEKAG